MSSVLDTHQADLPDDMRARLLRIEQLQRDFLRACRAFDQAAEGPDSARLLDEVTRLKDAFEQAWSFLELPFPAESLIKAKTFDAFCANLPNVDLTQLLGPALANSPGFR